MRVDQRKNQEVYGHDVCAESLLRGKIDAPPGVAVLADAIHSAEGQLVAAAFEPSEAGSELCASC